VVAVKVIEYLEDKSVSGSLLEGLLSEKVQHPNVVGRTLPPLPILNTQRHLLLLSLP